MTRAERRRAERQEKKKEQTYVLTRRQIQAMKEKMTEAVADELLGSVFGIAVMVIHDKFGQLMKKEQDGRSREERFFDSCMELYDSFEQGYLTLDDIRKTLRDECGVVLGRPSKENKE